MKNFKYLFAASVICFASSCNKIEKDSDSTISFKGETTVSIQATFSIPQAGEMDILTKTSIGTDEKTIYWDKDDQVSFFFGEDHDNKGGDKFSIYKMNDTKTAATFVGNLQHFVFGEDTGDATNYLWGVYPYDENTRCDNETVTVRVPQFQRCLPGTFDNRIHMAVGKSEDFKMKFSPILSGIKFQLDPAFFPEDITMVELTALDDTQMLVGDVHLDVINAKAENQDIKYIDVQNGEHSVILKPIKNNGYVELNKVYYLEFIPQTLHGIRITFYTPSKIGVYEFTGNLPANRNTFIRMTSGLNAEYGSRPNYGVQWKTF